MTEPDSPPPLGNCRDSTCARPLAPRHAEPPPGHVEHRGHGLCNSCHERHRTAHTLRQFPRLSRTAGQVLTGWEFLQARGHDLRSAAGVLGMTYPALRIALRRAGVQLPDSRRAAPAVERPTARAGWSRPGLFDPTALDEGEDPPPG